MKLSENSVLRKIFGCKRGEVAGSWRRLHSEELHSLYISPNIINVIKTRRMKWVGHSTHMGDEKCIQKFGQKI